MLIIITIGQTNHSCSHLTHPSTVQSILTSETLSLAVQSLPSLIAPECCRDRLSAAPCCREIPRPFCTLGCPRSPSWRHQLSGSHSCTGLSSCTSIKGDSFATDGTYIALLLSQHLPPLADEERHLGHREIYR